jgi:predicted ArsR family transcriptional regulator
METVVLATGVRPVRASDAAGQERTRMVQLADRPCSAAEMAAWLRLPLQVALVLVSDLVAEGLLDASRVTTSQSDDVLFLERLIAGVAAL